MDIAGSVVLVTGANRGVGAEFVAELLRRGAVKVYAGARDVSTVPGSAAIPVQLDITDPESVAAAAAGCGDVNIVINNAGLARGQSLLGATSLAGVRDEFETNVFGTLSMVRSFAPVIAANGPGAIVNMLSVLAWLSMPVAGGYCASKAAELSVTNSLRVELAEQKTQVLAIHCGAIDTEMGRSLPDPKLAPSDVAARSLDALEAGLAEVLLDDVSTTVRRALSGDLSLLYPEAVAARSTPPEAVSAAVAPQLEPTSLEHSGAFVSAAGLVVDSVTSLRVEGHIDVGDDHHTPWGIVHGGVYATAIESAASIGASDAVREQGMVAVGLTNTTHFLRSITSGRVSVVAEALNQGRTQQLWQVDVRDSGARLLAHGELRLQNVTAG